MQRVNGAGSGSGLTDLRADLEAAVNGIFQGSPAQRRAYVDRLYSKARPRLCSSIGFHPQRRRACYTLEAPLQNRGLGQFT